MYRSIFDTHAHYDDEKFDEDRDGLLASLPSKGVVNIINCGCDLASSLKSVEFSEEYDYFYSAVGIHPSNITDASYGELEKISGSAEMAKEVLKLGMYIGFGGAVTFKNARKPLEVAEIVPDDRLLLETDCPYMTPVPFRGQRNSSDLIEYSAEKLAEVRHTDTQKLIDTANENARRLFRI